MEEEIFNIISHGGDARAFAYEALEAARTGDMKKAEEKLKISQKELDLAHNTQTKLIQRELNDKPLKMSLLMVHAQDQLMTAISEKCLIEQMIKMYEEFRK